MMYQLLLHNLAPQLLNLHLLSIKNTNNLHKRDGSPIRNEIFFFHINATALLGLCHLAHIIYVELLFKADDSRV